MITCAVDIGSNSVRAAVAEVDPENFSITRFLYSKRKITRLGENIYGSSRLTDGAIKRTADFLAEVKKDISGFKVERTFAAATSAVREAENQMDFLNACSAAGFTVQVITGEMEAKYTIMGVKCLYPGNTDLLVYDIGGGSTELSLAKGDNVIFTESIGIGVVKLSDRFNMSGQVSADTLENCSIFIAAQMQNAFKNVNCGNIHGYIPVGTAGAVTTIAAVELGLNEYSASDVNNFTITSEIADRIIERFMPLTAEERLKIPGVSKGREDLIIPGALIIKEIFKLAGAGVSHISDYGLREGLLIAAGVH